MLRNLFLSVVVLLLANVASAEAGTKEYLEILSLQETPEKRAATCFRALHIASAIIELALKADIRAGNQSGIRKESYALRQTHLRVIFIQKIIDRHNLQSLSDQAYEVGVNMNVVDAADQLSLYCMKPLNKLVTQKRQLAEEAAIEAELYVRKILEKY